ncbi:MAG: 23S rRNA (adenine(2030)-N(6))-methyltransferase RlmJ [Alphaproteobacteria bacterium]|nr:23S rRNA (adenine(2030)-N(6))-methyltransferase RlmJ [Alphaproteobacteria bacterium]
MDYDHAFHAANHADVWKHTALLAVLASLKRTPPLVFDTHGGRGRYSLAGTGEWTAGLGRLLEAVPAGHASGSAAVDRYLGAVRRLCPDVPRSYPGSPLLALDALPRNGRLRVHEVEPEALSELRQAVKGDGRAQVVGGDGLAALDGLPTKDPVLVVLDPPYVTKPEWPAAAEAVQRVHAARKDATVFLWYPVKRWSRPNTLHDTLREAGVPFVALELLVTPLELERRALAGSGVLLVGASLPAQGEILAAAPVLGPALATHDGRWQVRVVA